MPWFRLDDGWYDHPKVIAAGNAAAGLWVRCAVYSANQLTNGFISHAISQRIGTKTQIDRVTESGLWTPVDGGYQIPDFLQFNPSADQVKADREAAAERQRRYRASRRDSRRDRDEASRRESHDPDPTRPDPYLKDSQQQQKSVQTDARAAAAINQHVEWRTRNGHIANPSGLANTIATKNGAALLDWLDHHPDAQPIDAAVAILGTQPPPTPRTQRNPCARCDSTGWIEHPTIEHTSAKCPDCTP